jgi:hypothetical protein
VCTAPGAVVVTAQGQHCNSLMITLYIHNNAFLARAAACYIDLMRGNLAWAAETKQLHSFPTTALHELQQGGGIETAAFLIRSQSTPSSRVYIGGTTTTSLSSLLFVVFSGQTRYEAKTTFIEKNVWKK